MLQQLFAEQTSVPDLAGFVVVVAVLCVLGAGAIYLAGMSIAWAATPRPRRGWVAGVLPDLGALRRNLPEIVLALATSSVLAVTLAAKHQVVDQVLAFPADSLFRTHVLEALFPLHRYPTPEEVARGGRRDRPAPEDSVLVGAGRIGRAGVASFLLPALAAGREGEVRAVVDTVLQRVLGRSPSLLKRVERWLLVGCFALIATYLAWLVWRRLPGLKAGGEAEAGPPELARRVAILGLCVGLLLAGPVMSGSRAVLADGVIKALPQHEPEPEATALREAVARGVHGQTELLVTLRVLAGLEDTASVLGLVGGIGERLDEMGAAIGRLGRQVNSLGDSLGAAAGKLADLERADVRQNARLVIDSSELRRLGRDVHELQRVLDSTARAMESALRRLTDTTSGRLNNLESRLRRLEQDLAATRGRELIVVETVERVPYRIYGGPAPETGGRGAGAHWLPPGTYWVSNRQDSVQVTLRLGEPRVVQLRWIG